MAPAPWQLKFEALTSWLLLTAGGVELVVGAFPPHTCRACGLSAVVLPRLRRPAGASTAAISQQRLCAVDDTELPAECSYFMAQVM